MTNKTEISPNTYSLPITGKFRKKPVVIDAYRLPLADDPVQETFHDWCEKVGFVNFYSDRDEGLVIPTLEGDMRAEPGDWIIKGVKGEFYPCKPDIFTATYEPADGEIDLEAADFSDALLWLKEGKRVTRKGWNGKGQFVLKAGGYTVNEARPGSDYARAGIVGEFTIQPHLDLKNAQGRMQPGWVPSQGDLFATDWQVYVEQPASVIPAHQQRVLDERAALQLSGNSEHVGKLTAIGWIRADYRSDYRMNDAPLFVLGASDPSTAWGVKYIPLVNSPVIPDGWQLVPIRPNEAMIEAGKQRAFLDIAENNMFFVSQTYIAMLAAAPAIDAVMNDALQTGTGFMQVSTDGVAHAPREQVFNKDGDA